MGKIIICKICERALFTITLKLSFLKVMGLDKKIENVQKFRVDKSKRAGNSGGDKPLPLIPHHSSIPFFSFSFSFLFYF